MSISTFPTICNLFNCETRALQSSISLALFIFFAMCYNVFNEIDIHPTRRPRLRKRLSHKAGLERGAAFGEARFKMERY